MENKSFHPLVSIIIPVYNGENYVKEAIDSALAQTYDNIEIIVVNDGSKDNTEKIIKSYGKKIKYYKKENGGVATALNLAIEKSNGEYISWLSHDDLYSTDKINKQVDRLYQIDRNNRKKTIIWSNYALIDKNAVYISEQQYHKTHEFKKLNYPLYPLLNGLLNGCTLLIPKPCFDEIGLFDISLKATQDYDLWFKMFKKYNLLFMPEIFVKSRWHSEQGSKKILTANQECSSLWIMMVKNTTYKQKREISGSVANFYRKTFEIVSNAGYTKASDYLSNIISRLKIRDISKIKVSIIIPFRDRIGWTIEAIKSAQTQTHKNIEILLIDDGSIEDTQQILKILKNDKRIRFIKNEKVLGPGKSRNIGIKKATGEYIAFLDSDDIFNKNKIEIQLNYLIKNLEDFCHTSYNLFDCNNRFIKKIESGKTNNEYPYLISNCAIATPSVMMSKEIIESNGIKFPEKVSVAEDTCFWISCSKLCKLNGINIPLVSVRDHGKNAAFDQNKQIIGLKNIYDYVFCYSMDDKSIDQIYILNNEIIKLFKNKLGITKETITNIKYKTILDKIYRYPLVGHLIVKIILRIKKIFNWIIIKLK